MPCSRRANSCSPILPLHVMVPSSQPGTARTSLAALSRVSVRIREAHFRGVAQHGSPWVGLAGVVSVEGGGMRNADLLSEVERLQLGEAIATYRMQFSLLIQAGTVLVTASLTVLGFGFTTRSAFLVWLAVSFLVALIVLAVQARRSMKPVIVTAITLENRAGLGDEGLGHCFVGQDRDPTYLERIRALAAHSGPERHQAVRRLPDPWLGPVSRGMFGVFYIVLLILVLLAIGASVFACTSSYEWSWFGGQACPECATP